MHFLMTSLRLAGHPFFNSRQFQRQKVLWSWPDWPMIAKLRRLRAELHGVSFRFLQKALKIWHWRACDNAA
jgi:hypothetical protein